MQKLLQRYSFLTIPGKKNKFLFHQEIAEIVERHNILHLMILNIDQTPLKYVSVENFNLTEKKTTSVTMDGSNVRIILYNNFLPVQLIHARKKENISRFKFPEKLSLSANPTHYSNLIESIKLIHEVIFSYLEIEWQQLNLIETLKGLVIMDIFTGQVTDDVPAALHKNHICNWNVPSNMTRFYQPLVLIVNGHVKKFMKYKINSWHISQITEEIDEGVEVDKVNVRLLLSTLKSLHAGWVV